MDKNHKVRLGFIGSGNIAGMHAEKLAAIGQASIVAFSDVVPERAKLMADRYAARAYGHFELMLDKESLDAVMLCTPHQTRLEPIKAIAARGLPLFCEKPPAFTMEDARAC